MFFVAFQSPQNRIEAAPLRFFACPKRRQSTNMCVGSSELYKRLLLGTVLLLLSQSSHYILPFQKSRLRAPHGVRFSCSPLFEIQKTIEELVDVLGGSGLRLPFSKCCAHTKIETFASYVFCVSSSCVSMSQKQK
jgi:hypothetical protein